MAKLNDFLKYYIPYFHIVYWVYISIILMFLFTFSYNVRSLIINISIVIAINFVIIFSIISSSRNRALQYILNINPQKVIFELINKTIIYYVILVTIVALIGESVIDYNLIFQDALFTEYILASIILVCLLRITKFKLKLLLIDLFLGSYLALVILLVEPQNGLVLTISLVIGQIIFLLIFRQIVETTLIEGDLYA